MHPQNQFVQGWNAAPALMNPTQCHPSLLLPVAAPSPFALSMAPVGLSAPAAVPLASQVRHLQDLIAQSAKQIEQHRVHMMQQDQQASMQLMRQQQQLEHQIHLQSQLQRQQQLITPISHASTATQGAGISNVSSASTSAASVFSSPSHVPSIASTPLCSPMPLRQSSSPVCPEVSESAAISIGQLPPMVPSDEGMDDAAAFLAPVTLPSVSVQLERSGTADSPSTGPLSQGNTCSSSPNPPSQADEMSAQELAALDQRSMYAGRRMACAGCHAVKSSCEGGRPCARCVRVGRPCIQREKARAKKKSPEPKSSKKLLTPPGPHALGAAAAGAASSSSTWSPGLMGSPPFDSTHSSASSTSRSLGDASSPSLTTSPYPSPLGHSMRITSRESSVNAAVSPVHQPKHRKISASDEDSTTPPKATHHRLGSHRSIPSQSQRSRSPSDALHGMALHADITPPRASFATAVFDPDQVAVSSSSVAASSKMHAAVPSAHDPSIGSVVDFTAMLSSACLRNHLATDSLNKVRSKLMSHEWSVSDVQRFVAELATQLTVADLATLVERSEGPRAVSSSQISNTMSRLHSLVLLPASPLFMLSWHASPMVATPSACMDAELTIERLVDAPHSPTAERKRKRELEQHGTQEIAAAAAAPSDESAPVSACAVNMLVSTNLGLAQLLGFSHAEVRARYIQFGNHAPLLFLRPDYVGPFHLLSLQCSLQRIHEFVAFAVFRSRDGMDQSLCCHFKSDIAHDGTVERTRTVYRLMPAGPLPPYGAHINLLQPYPTS